MGGSSSQVVGYRYYAKFAAFVGNRIEKLLAINFDNRKWVVHDPLKHPPNLLPVLEGNLFGENEGGVSGNVDIHFGTPDQEPNSEYQKYLPLVSGYPYQSYLVFREITSTNPLTGKQTTAPGFYLGNSGYMKEMLLWVKRTRVRNDGRVQWYEVRGDGAVVCEIGARYTGANSVIEKPTPLNIVIGSSTENWYNAANDVRVSSDNREFKEVILENDVWGTLDLPGRNIEYGFLPENIPLVRNFRFETSPGGGLVVLVVSASFANIGQRPFDESLFQASFSGPIVDIEKNTVRRSVIWRVRAMRGEPVVGKITCNLFKDSDNGSFAYFMNHETRILGFYQESRFLNSEIQGIDINPIHKIREILTDDTAMGKPESDVNDENFIKAADRIYDEGLGVSWAIDEKSCIEAIEELCYHIEAGIRVNRQTGLYEMVLFRDDWFAEGEIHTIAENKIKDLSLEVMNSDDIVNQLNVTYYDRKRIKNSTFSIYENGSILTMGKANAESIDFPYFMKMRNAEIVANWKLKQYSTPAWKGTLTTGWREARKWNRYDLVKINWSKKWEGTILARIMKIDLGNGLNNEVMIDFEEVIPYSGEMNTSIVVDTPVDAGSQPPQPSINAVFEAPYYLTVLRAGQTNVDLELSNNPDIGYVAAIAAKPQNNSLNALLFTDSGVGEFEQVSRLDYCDILQLDQPINETMSAFVVTGSLTQTANSNNLILLNDELMGFVSFDDATKVLTVKRGVLDTIPKKHNSGNLFLFDLPDVAFDSTQYAQSEVVEAQVLTTTPSGVQELSATGIPIEIQSRAIRPYPPANVKINGEYYPAETDTDLVLTWVDRNRSQQTGGEILGWFDDGVMIEYGTTYQLVLVEYDENDAELTTQNLSIGAVNTYTFATSEMDANTRTIEITLKSLRDGYESLQVFEHRFKVGFAAPYNVVATYDSVNNEVNLEWGFDE